MVMVNEHDVSGDSNHTRVELFNDVVDVTSFNDDYREFLEGVASFRINVNSYWNNSVDTLDPEAYSEIANGPSGITILPEGSDRGDIGVHGSAFTKRLTLKADVKGPAILDYKAEGTLGLSRVHMLEKEESVSGGTGAHHSGVGVNVGASSSPFSAYFHLHAFSGWTSGIKFGVWGSSIDGFYGIYAQSPSFFVPTVGEIYKVTSTLNGPAWRRATISVLGSGSMTFSCFTEQ